jgi:hypothetical protein
MKLLSVILSLLVAQTVSAQTMPWTFVPVRKDIFGQPGSFINLPNSKVCEIIIMPDSSFEFQVRPHVSCLTWLDYKGTWRREKDTLFFGDHYEVKESGVKATYKRDSMQSFRFSFKTDRNEQLSNRDIKIRYIYDFFSELQDVDKMFTLNPDNTLEIPFKNIPNLNKLASIEIKYQLNGTEERYGYLTQNKIANIKKGDLPNIIDVEFVHKPQKEIVYRTIKGVMQQGTLAIVSSTKTKSMFPDYQPDIELEETYELSK